MQILLIIQGIEAALAAAPGAIEVAMKAKALIEALFTAKAITKAQQDALFARVDSYCQMFAAGIVPDGWEVRPNPQ
jgi:hypothetical protein